MNKILTVYLLFQANDVSSLSDSCQHSVWTHTVQLLEDERLKEAAERACSQELSELTKKCQANGVSNLLGCLMDHRDDLHNAPCRAFVQRVEYVAFSDYRFLPRFSKDCKDDIDKLQCGRLELGTKVTT